MNSFSKEVYQDIIAIFPQLEGLNKQDSELLEFHLENENQSALGDLYIQTSADDQIWIRSSHPFTTYAVENVEELVYIIGGIVSNEMFWVISYEEDEWDDSFFVLKGQEIDLEEGITYKMLCWNGVEDQIIKA